MEIPGWNHLDYMWAMDAKPALYDKVVEILKRDKLFEKTSQN